MTHLGKAVALGRAVQNIRQQTMAELLNVTPSHVSLIEAGKRQPSMDVLEKIALILNLPIDMLVFMATLVIAYVYAWRKGVFRWR